MKVSEAQDRIEQIRERLAKATPGPWKTEVDEIGLCECPLCNGDGEVEYADINGNGWVALAQTYGIGDMIEHNADFIANAPTDIAFLLELVESMKCCCNCKLEKEDLDTRCKTCEDGYTNWQPKPKEAGK